VKLCRGSISVSLILRRDRNNINKPEPAKSFDVDMANKASTCYSDSYLVHAFSPQSTEK
jgi:hypothetical protein